MKAPFNTAELQHVENFLASGDIESALPCLLDLRDAAEDFIKEYCQTTDEVQYFSFADEFELLAYRRVEDDPREIVQVDVPFDRLYSDLAYAHIQEDDYGPARDALMQAVRWNPMNCSYRLDLAEVFRLLGNEQEWAALSHSVLDRASDALSAGRAYSNLGVFFANQEELEPAVGCLRMAERYAAEDARVQQLSHFMKTEHADALELSEERANAAMESQGVPAALNAEIAICLIMCATDAASAGDTAEATRLTVRARDLVGMEAAKALIQLVRESDAELAYEKAEQKDVDND